MPHVIDLRRLNSHLRYISLLSFPVLTHRTPKIGQDFTGISLHFSFFLSEQKKMTQIKRLSENFLRHLPFPSIPIADERLEQ